MGWREREFHRLGADHDPHMSVPGLITSPENFQLHGSIPNGQKTFSACFIAYYIVICLAFNDTVQTTTATISKANVPKWKYKDICWLIFYQNGF